MSPGAEGGWTWWGPEVHGGSHVHRGRPRERLALHMATSVSVGHLGLLCDIGHREQWPHIWDSGCPGRGKPGVTAILVNILLCVPGFGVQVRRAFYLCYYCYLHFSEEKAEG